MIVVTTIKNKKERAFNRRKNVNSANQITSKYKLEKDKKKEVNFRILVDVVVLETDLDDSTGSFATKD